MPNTQPDRVLPAKAPRWSCGAKRAAGGSGGGPRTSPPQNWTVGPGHGGWCLPPHFSPFPLPC